MFGSGCYCVLRFSVWSCWDLVFGSGYYCVLGFSLWFWLLCVEI